ncbi:MAG: LamG-like jellyroll fold domain-containing protein [Planctomycetota bacterium]|jgi:probable HAF family extracellular repeat protein
MKSHISQLVLRLILVLYVIGSVAQSYGQPVLRYGFDNNNADNRDARDVGASPAADGIFTGDAIRMADPPANFSCGALDLTPNGAIDNYVTTGADVNKIDGLAEMTLTLWLNLRSDPADDDRLLSKLPSGFPTPPANTGGWGLWIDGVASQPARADNFSLIWGVYKSTGSSWQGQGSTSNAINADQRWVFIAITYNASKTLTYYIGDENNSVSQLGLPWSFSYPLLGNDVDFRVGSDPSNPGTDRTPPAWIDDVRVYDIALNSAQLEQIRLENIEITNLYATPTFFGLGGFPNGSCGALAQGMSADGSVVVGIGFTDDGATGFRWEAGNMIAVGDLPGGDHHSQAIRCSDDGSVIVGWSISALSDPYEAFRWEAGVINGLGDLPGGNFYSYAYSVSGDGSIVVGRGAVDNGVIEAFRWEAGTMVGLGALDPVNPLSVAFDISPDGSVIVGGTSSPIGDQAFRWENNVMTGLGELPGGGYGSYATAISADKSVIIGYSESAQSTPRYEAFRWKNNNMIGLGDFPGGDYESSPWGLSADGSVIVGDSETDVGNEAFIWDSMNGMRKLHDLLENDYGLDLTGWWLTTATDISDDGLTITGYGRNPHGRTEPWIARLDKPITSKNADYDNDNDVDDDDFLIFEACATGPAIPYDAGNLPPGCILVPNPQGFIDADYDADLDVDHNDFAGFQLCYSGQNITADPGCRD